MTDLLIHITRILIASVTVLALLYDAFAFAHSGYKVTISWQLYQGAKKYPAIPFFFGLLMGHLFLSQVC